MSAQHTSSGLNGPPEQPSPKDPERRTTSPGFMRASYPKHLKADRTAWTRWGVNVERTIRAECFLYIFDVPGVPLRATQRTRMRDSRMSEGGKDGPARQRRTAHPRVVTGRPDRARGMRGLALTVPSCVLIIWITALGKSRRRTARGP